MAIYLAVIFWIISVRILLPISDEPDWWVKLDRLYENHANIFYSNKLIDELINSSFACNLLDDRASLYGRIGIECVHINSDLFYRILVQICFISIVLLVFILYGRSKINNNLFSGYSQNNAIKSILATYMFPGFIYNSGFMSNEQFCLILSLLLMLRPGFIFRFLIYIFVISIDLGNGVIVVLFDISYAVIKYFLDINRKIVVYSILIFLILFYTNDKSIVNIFGSENILNILVDDKLTAIATLLNDGEVGGGGVIYRLMIFMTSLYFLTPSGVKAPLAMVIFYLSIFYLYLKYHLKSEIDIITKKRFYSSLDDVIIYGVLVIFVIVLFPNYSNSKYFVYLIPYLFMPLIVVMASKKVFLLLNISNAVLIIELLIQMS